MAARKSSRSVCHRKGDSKDLGHWSSDPTSSRCERECIPQSPGLGVDIDLDALAKHPYQPHDLRHYKGTLTDIRPADAGFTFKQ